MSLSITPQASAAGAAASSPHETGSSFDRVAMAGRATRGFGRLLAAANHDFCPQLNRYVYWLKRPVGWLAGAMFASSLLALFVSPDCWALVAAFAVVLALGLAWPSISIRAVSVEWQVPSGPQVEGSEIEIRLSVRNRAWWPIHGLAIEFDRPLDSLVDAKHPERTWRGLALDRCAALTESTFTFKVRGLRRGSFPATTPSIACGFPFGLRIARRPIDRHDAVTIRPWSTSFVGTPRSRTGSAAGAAESETRTGRVGEVTGVREWVAQDPFREIDWVQTSRRDRLMVRDRSASVRPTVRLVLLGRRDEANVRIAAGSRAVDDVARIDAEAREDDETLRWLASVARTLVREGWDVRLPEGDRWTTIGTERGLDRWLDRIASLDVDRLTSSVDRGLAAGGCETWVFVRPGFASAPRVAATAASFRRLLLPRAEEESGSQRIGNTDDTGAFDFDRLRDRFARRWQAWCEERQRVIA
ncbi:MAG TPA: DUF58 domain-containing protein [Pirellulaceae bacterium]|nr:DUF58 domain-containing protein [Pirellulaceae bacterium]